MQPTAADYQAARWLAQLAVNIVDYIDDDDYSTPFQWYQNPNPAATAIAPEGWVFGVELPRLVLNEAYAQQEASGLVNIWAEMYNPFKSYNAGTYVWSPTDNGSAVLQQTGNVPYIIEVHNKDSAFTTAMQSPANPTGYAANPLSTMLGAANAWGPNAVTHSVLPGNGVQSSLVAKVIGPATANPATAGASHVGQVVTIRVPAGHGLTVGAASPDLNRPVQIAGVAVPGYNGTFLISGIPNATHLTYTDPALTAAAITPSGGGTVTYGGNPNGPAGTYDQALGFYVVGPQSAAPLYTSSANLAIPPRNPNVLATYLAPAGMSFTNTPLPIRPPSALAGATGVSHVGTTVTVNLLAALPVTAAVGDAIVLQNVVTQVGKKGAPTPAVYNNTAANPTWTITSINAARTSFTFTYTGIAALPAAGTESGNGAATVQLQAVTLLLRRLANPHLAYQPNPATANPPYNPYITVDSFDITTINPQPNALAGSFGRTQPYAGSDAQMANTFFSQNVLNATYNWLVHLDRPPVNAIELLHVSGCRPHELTQMFGGNYGHYAPWNPLNTSAPAQPIALIYRALDQMSTRYMAGQYAGGRSQGNINLNSLTELEVWQALCDAHDASSLQYPNPWFTQSDVQTLFTKLGASRGAPIGAAPTAEPMPFKSFSAATTTQTITGTTTTGLTVVTGVSSTVGLAVGAQVYGLGIPAGATVGAIGAGTITLSQAAGVTGSVTLNVVSSTGNQVSMNDTWFRLDPTTGRPLFTPPSVAVMPNPHPYLQGALLQKIYNNITTTSNVFAIWWTVGFFEVVDETVKPARLGQEIGRAQNKHVRHRFFAIVDRSGLQLANTTSTTAVALAANAGVPQTLTVKYNATGVMTPTGPIAQWKNTPTYVPGNIVYEPAGANAVAYYCIKANTNVRPTTPLTAANSPYWQSLIQPGMLLEVDTGANMEVVAVTSVGTTAATSHTITANFAKAHNIGAAGVPIVIRGNPGPQTVYNPHDDPGVVLHMSVIK